MFYLVFVFIIFFTEKGFDDDSFPLLTSETVKDIPKLGVRLKLMKFHQEKVSPSSRFLFLFVCLLVALVVNGLSQSQSHQGLNPKYVHI